MKELLLPLILLFLSSYSLGQVEETPFVYEGGELLAHKRCKVNFNRGDSCKQLLKKLCQRIGYNHKDCRKLQVRECHDNNLKNQTKEERECKKGSHAEPCFGIHKSCSQQERDFCLISNFSGRFCLYYKWQYCRNTVGTDGSGEFESLDCRKFHNKEMIDFYNRKTQEKLAWQAYGENHIRTKLPALQDQKKSVEENLRAIKKQIDKIDDCLDKTIFAGCISGLTSRSQLKKQKRKLQKQRDEYEVLLTKLKRHISDFEHAQGLCRYWSPIRRSQHD